MCKHHIFTTSIIVFFFSLSANAQMITGKIVNQSNNSTIPYAHIIINESYKGTISNAEGKFELNLIKQPNQLKLTISSIGYKTKTISINKNELHSNCKIALEKNNILLSEFDVVYESAETILKNFQKNYAKNYNPNSFLLKGFYRTTFSENGVYVNLLEASVNVREFPKKKKREFETAITQQRKSNDYRTEKWSESGNYLYQTVAENPVIQQTQFLNPKHLKHYILKRLDNTTLGDNLVYVISFTVKPTTKRPLSNATVYIQANNYALIKAEFNYLNDELKIRNLSYNQKTIHTTSNNGSIEYQKVGNWYYPKYISGNTVFEIISKETKDTLVKNILLNEVLFTDFTDSYDKPLENTTKKWGDVYKKPFDYNPEYWNNEVKLPPTKLQQDAIKDLDNFQTLELQYFNNSAKNKLTQSFDNTPTGKIDSLLTIYHLTNLFNGVALITYDNKTLLHKAYGYSDLKEKIKLNPSSVFDIGSITKQYTAAIILKLEQNGKLKLKDRIKQYLPNYKHSAITIHQLLSHTSGIPTFDIEENNYHSEWFKNKITTLQFITKFCSEKLDFLGIELDSTHFISFSHLTVDALANNRAVWLHNNSSDISFDNVEFLNGATTSSSRHVIVASASATSALSGGNNVKNLTIKNCSLDGGYHAIMILGQGANNKSPNFTIENNTITNAYYYGIRMYNTEGVSIKGNKITTTGSTSYALIFQDLDDFEISQNETNGGNYGLYINGANKTGVPVRSKLENNMFIGGKYGVYFKSTKHVNIYHNSIYGEDRGIYMDGNFNKNFDFVNNIVATDMGEVIFTTHVPATAIYDYNIYNTLGSTAFKFGSNTYSTLAAWQTGVTTENDSSLFGDPVFVAADDLRINLGTLANDKGDNTVNVLIDIDSNLRTASGATRVDIGAYEYTPVSEDVGMVSGMLLTSDCLSQTDTVTLVVENVSGTPVNLATDSIVVNWNVTGPINSMGTLVANSGSLAVGSTLNLMTTANLSQPGLYSLNAFVEPSAFNLLLTNDTLATYTVNVYDNWIVTPTSDTINAITDSAEFSVSSLLFEQDQFFITEMSQYTNTTTGMPSGGKPTWLGADDYIEITGAPNSDLGGITLEQWSDQLLLGTFTFAQGTFLSPSGTAVIAVGDLGSSAPSPSNFYYHGNGTYFGNFSSGTETGRILKDANNRIIDAVGFGVGYAFPAAANVSTAEWSGNTPSGAASWGLRLEGEDMNNGTGWIATTATVLQNPNGVNSMVQVPSATAITSLTWSEIVSGSLTQISTSTSIKVGASTPGIFYYQVAYNSTCGMLIDTVAVYSFIAGCPGPTAVSTTTTCTSATLSWNSDAGTTTSYIEYGLTGFTLGSGNPINNAMSPHTIGNLTANTTYDFYLIDSCVVGGSSTPIKVTDSTLNSFVSPTFTWNVNTTTPTFAEIAFDASASVNGTNYTWDFGDASATATGVNPTHQYMNNGSYYATVTIAGVCDTAVYGDTIIVEGISVQEDLLSQSLTIYPNPSTGKFRVEFDVEGLNNVSITVFTIQGQEVYRSNKTKVSGRYTEAIDISRNSEGIYFVQISVNEKSSIKKVVLNK